MQRILHRHIGLYIQPLLCQQNIFIQSYIHVEGGILVTRVVFKLEYTVYAYS